MLGTNTGKDNISELLKKSEADADWLDRSLPHVADEMRTLVKCVRAYDKNQKAFIKFVVNTQKQVKIWEKVLKLTITYLSPIQLRYVQQYEKELAKEVMPDEPT